MMDIRVFRQIGFTDGETRVYLALLKLGSTTTGPLTRESKISRSKVYEILDRLMEKGIVSYIIKEKTKHFQAAEPAKISQYISEKEKEFSQQKEAFEAVLPQLKLQQQLEKKGREVQVFKGFKGIQTVHEHLFLKLSRGDEYLYMGIPALQAKKYLLYWDRMHQKRMRHGISCKLLFNQGANPKHLRKRNSQQGCEARIMSFPIQTPAWLLIYKDISVIGLPSDEEMAIEIINDKVAKSFREYFNAFWRLTRPFK